MLPTTAAVLEILIIGIQAIAWLTLSVAAILGRSELWARIFDLPDALTVGAVGLVAYALGVMVDRAADSMDRLFKNHAAKHHPRVPIMRLRMMAVDDGRSRFLEYQRSRVRIARATSLNAALLGGALAGYMAVRTQVGLGKILLVEAVVALVLFGSFFGARRIGDAYDHRLADAYSMWARDNPEQARGDRDA